MPAQMVYWLTKKKCFLAIVGFEQLQGSSQDNFDRLQGFFRKYIRGGGEGANENFF